jgi:hypothetical protein
MIYFVFMRRHCILLWHIIAKYIHIDKIVMKFCNIFSHLALHIERTLFLFLYYN